MALNLEQIEAYFVEEGLRYDLADEGHLLTGFATSSYRGSEGRCGIGIVIRLDEDGEYFEMTTPRLFDASLCKHPAALFEVLLAITMRTKLIRFEYDPSDGEIRASIQHAVEDGEITKRQFLRMLKCLPETIDRWEPIIRLAMEKGVVNLKPISGGGDHLARLAALEADAGGIEELETLVRRAKDEAEKPEG